MMARLSSRRSLKVLPGSLITLRRKCGKAGCRCASGAPHETPALSYSVDGHSKMLTLAPGEVEEVARAVARYKQAVGALEQEARAELDELLARVQARRTGARR
jgi:hypothetical protein